MGVEIKFKVRGREVSRHDFGNAIQAAAYEHMKNRVAEKLRDVRCPEHREYAQVTAEGDDLEHLRWTVSGCCEKVREEAQKALRR